MKSASHPGDAHERDRSPRPGAQRDDARRRRRTPCSVRASTPPTSKPWTGSTSSKVRAEWDALIAEMSSDPNKGHFVPQRGLAVRSREPAGGPAPRVARLPGQLGHGRVLGLRALRRDQEAHQESRDPRAVHLHGPRRGASCRLHQRRAEGVRGRHRPRLSDQGQEVHLLPAEVHLLRDLSVGEDRLRPLHHHLSPAAAPPRAPLSSDLPVVRAVVQRRVPPRRGVRAADARRPDRCSPASTSSG